jgi:putative salt-induced outer membrane protein
MPELHVGVENGRNRVRFMKTLAVITALLCVLSPVVAAAQGQSTRSWGTEFGAGLALTNGNSDTKNINLSLNLVWDPKARNLFRVNGLYLRGDKDGTLIINQTALTARDEINMSTRTFVFFQGSYLKDTFKNISYLFSPTAGVGYKLINSDAMLLAIDTGFGGVWERDTGIANRDTQATGAYNVGQRFAWKASSTATVTQSVSSLWKTNDWSDSLHSFSAGIAASLTQRTQLKLEFLDTFKNRPALATLKKNDTALITSLVLKF